MIPCIPCGSADALDVAPGTLDARAGQAAYDAVMTATQLGVGRPGRRHHDRAAAEGGVAPGGPRLSGPHGVAGPRVRRRRLRDDALPGPERGRAFAGRAGRGPRDAAHGAAERVRRIDRRGDSGEGPAGRPIHDAVDAAGRESAERARRRGVARATSLRIGRCAAADRRLLAESARRRGRTVRRRGDCGSSARPSSADWPRVCGWKDRCRPTR